MILHPHFIKGKSINFHLISIKNTIKDKRTNNTNQSYLYFYFNLINKRVSISVVNHSCRNDLRDSFWFMRIFMWVDILIWMSWFILLLTFFLRVLPCMPLRKSKKIDIVIKSTNHFDGGKHLLSLYKSNSIVLHWFILIVYIRDKSY